MGWNRLTSLPSGYLTTRLPATVRSLHVEGMALTETHHTAIKTRFPNLVHLYVGGTGLSATQVNGLLDGLPVGLLQLGLDGNDLSGVTWSKLTRFTTLHTLDVTGANLDDAAASAIAANASDKLVVLRMGYNGLTAVPSLSRFNVLQILYLDHNGLDEADVWAGAFVRDPSATLELLARVTPGNPGITSTDAELASVHSGVAFESPQVETSLRVEKLLAGRAGGGRQYGFTLNCRKTGGGASRVHSFTLPAGEAVHAPVHAPGLLVASVTGLNFRVMGSATCTLTEPEDGGADFTSGLFIDAAITRDGRETVVANVFGGEAPACVGILDADTAPVEGGAPVTVTVTLPQAAPAGGVKMPLLFLGTQSPRSDYTVSSLVAFEDAGKNLASITINEGATTARFTITLTDDDKPDDGNAIHIIAEDPDRDPPDAKWAGACLLTIADSDVEEPPQPVPLVDWSPTLTVQDLGGGRLGCDNSHSDGDKQCGAALTDDRFILDGAAYIVQSIYTQGGDFYFGLQESAPDAIRDHTLRVDTHEFNFGGVGFNRGPANATVWRHANHLSWFAGRRVSLSMTPKPPPPPPVTRTQILRFLSANRSSVTEGQTVTITARLARAAESDLTIGITVYGQPGNPLYGWTELTDADWSLSPRAISIPSGQRSGTATLTIVDDSAKESSEYIMLNHDWLPQEAIPSGNAAYVTRSVRIDITDND